jgi:hypothetical protein
MKKIKIYEWIRGSVYREISIDVIQKELLKAVKNGEVQILNSSFSLDYLFSEKLICAVINFDEEILEEANVLDLEIYYDFYSGGYEEDCYPEFIRHFIENNTYELAELNFKSLDIDEWEIIDMEVE